MMTRQQFYKSKQWEAFRKVIIADRSDPDGFVHCCECGKPIINKYDLIIHHKQELTEANVNDAMISLNPDNPSDSEDVTYFSGAVRYGIKTLLTAYPFIKLIFVNLQNMGSTYNETAAWYNATGSHYVESATYNQYINDICAEFAVPVLDIWNTSMINDYTDNELYCDSGGKPHLSHKGKQKYVTMIENTFNRFY